MDSGTTERGTLTVLERAARTLALRAAAQTPGVRASSTPLDKITRRELPRVHLVVAANRVRVHLALALDWSHDPHEVSDAVTHGVRHALTTYGDFTVDAVAITIERFVVAEPGRAA